MRNPTFSSGFPDYIPKEVNKYKTIKEYKTSGGDIMPLGTIVRAEGNEQFHNFLIQNGYIQEMEEIKKYRFKKDFFDFFEKGDVISNNGKYYSDEGYNEYNSTIELIFNISKQEILEEYLEQLI